MRLEPKAVIYATCTPQLKDASVKGRRCSTHSREARHGKHHAQNLVVGAASIDIPPNGTGSFTGEWHVPEHMHVVALSTHQHRRGTGVAINRVDSGGGDLGDGHSRSWEHPTQRWFPEALDLQPGDGFRFTCT